MFGSILKKIQTMRPPVRALVFLYWIFAFTGSMVGVFTQIFLYQKFTSVPLNIIATIVFFTGIMIGFCVPGYLAALFRLNIKQGFMWSFLVMGLSIIYLLHASGVSAAYLAMFLWGSGQGLFWLTINTFELSETKELERDFYASVVNAGNQVLALAGPAIATLLLWLSGNILHWGSYSLLFTAAPAVFLLGFFCFSRIQDYRPAPIRWADVRHYFIDRKNQAAQIYTLGSAIQHILGAIVPPLVILFILGTPLRVGIYDTYFAIFSVICILIVSKYRTPSNRLKIYGLTSLGLVLATIWFGYAFTFAALIIYTIIDGILSPLLNVSSRVIDLGAMEIGRKETDFYPTMILRDLFLWIWRLLGGLAFLFIISSLKTPQAALSTGLYLLAAGLVLAYFGALLLAEIKKADIINPEEIIGNN